jgi:hypothetical protein
VNVDPTKAEPAALVRGLRSIGRALLVQPRWLSWILPVAWAGAIFLLSSLRTQDGPTKAWELGGLTGNLGHPAVFGMLALLLVPLARRRRPVPMSPPAPMNKGEGSRLWTDLSPEGALWIVAAVALYGFTDELHQSTVEGRDASAFDLLSDTVGAVAVVATVMYLGRSDANGPGLRRLLIAGFAASLLAAGIATLWGMFVGPSPWPF